jgi:hypothetical protein
MFSDPLDSSSSDDQSFDEDDMYGSDSGVETISLGPESKDEIQSLNQDLVSTHLVKQIHAILHLKQDTDIMPELESLETDMRDLSIMVKALCDAQGIDVTSIPGEAQGQSSSVPSPHSTSNTSLELQGGDRDDDS